MNTSGEVADLMVKEGLMITEEVVKLTGLGAKNLAAIIIALLQEDNKLQGETSLKKLLKSEKPLCIMQVKERDIRKFNGEAKRYGVLFAAVKDKINDTGICDIIAKQEDITKLNYIMEKLGYIAPLPEIEPEPEKGETGEDNISKKVLPRAKENQRESEYTKHGGIGTEGKRTEQCKISVKDRVNEIKEERKKGSLQNTFGKIVHKKEVKEK